jgi:hypothetical protein
MIQWPKEGGQKDKQPSTKKLHRKIKIEQHASPLKARDELWCF